MITTMMIMAMIECIHCLLNSKTSLSKFVYSSVKPQIFRVEFLHVLTEYINAFSQTLKVQKKKKKTSITPSFRRHIPVIRK